MDILGVTSCDLVFYTTKGIHVVCVDFDSELYQHIQECVDFFYSNYLFVAAVHKCQQE